MVERKCRSCGRPIKDSRKQVLLDFLEYIQNEHDDYDTDSCDNDLCLSCAIYSYESPMLDNDPGSWRLGEDDPVIFDPSEPDPYDWD